MKIIKFYKTEKLLKIKIENFNDLLNIQRVIFINDIVKARSLRKFKPEENDRGELKEVTIYLNVEKTEIDKDSEKLRIMGKIINGNPLKYIQLHSYHTLNIEKNNIIEIKKQLEWPNYLLKIIEDATKESKKPNLGIILIDEEKSLFAYLLGYGIDFINEIYSNLSKRMTSKDYQEHKIKYFNKIIELIKNMDVSIIIIGGPGFVKDDIKKFMEDNYLVQKLNKKLFYINVSNVEHSGVYELIKNNEIENILKNQKIRLEFKLMEEFLRQVSIDKSVYGIKNVIEGIQNYEISKILVNDNILNNQEIKQLLGNAEKNNIKIIIFNSNDEVGNQLHNFKDIAGIN